MLEIAGTFVYGAAAALVPLLAVEGYVVVMGAVVDPALLVPLALAVGAGQVVGKLAYYYVGRGVLRLPWLRRKAERPGRWTERVDRWREAAHGRPVWTGGLMLLSAFAGLPPLMVTSVLAGSVRMHVGWFVAVCMVGRTARFALLLFAPGMAAQTLGVLPGG
ncbi:hypothetical protein [Allonocardiopsis opalescens]|uniref:Membrane protein YqaA with SNARE-associated domain n=1 Tax=Allonocardiopsis opalescens TaxID=1144618 RepID=A0A2T0PVZ6_9ACTN|nr:hypothetical protein [Allonocardiopsis opalescens]PRX95528.1 membrane protein YqaA with SNARE-associated domain [Allonocardiopsis opalescens]